VARRDALRKALELAIEQLRDAQQRVRVDSFGAADDRRAGCDSRRGGADNLHHAVCRDGAHDKGRTVERLVERRGRLEAVRKVHVGQIDGVGAAAPHLVRERGIARP